MKNYNHPRTSQNDYSIRKTTHYIVCHFPWRKILIKHSEGSSRVYNPSGESPFLLCAEQQCAEIISKKIIIIKIIISLIGGFIF